jgi:CheY-like chemotaxis protein
LRSFALLSCEQKLMVMLMKKLGYTLLVAENGAEALELLARESARGRQYEIECILMDASMDVSRRDSERKRERERRVRRFSRGCCCPLC